MKLLFILLPLILSNFGITPSSFRVEQMTYTRVRQAYIEKSKTIDKTLAEHSISRNNMRIYLRAFKTEKKVELWAKNITDTAFTLVKEFPICDISGTIGPKRRSHDLQVPEGYYHLSRLNPYSKYYLSIEINYPNASDSIRGVRGHLGNQIFIHGSCISSGCIAITDEKIKELYVYVVEAYNGGQEQIGITIFPARLDDKKYNTLVSGYSKNKDKVSLWTDLKKGYDLFNLTKSQPRARVMADGRYEVVL